MAFQLLQIRRESPLEGPLTPTLAFVLLGPARLRGECAITSGSLTWTTSARPFKDAPLRGDLPGRRPGRAAQGLTAYGEAPWAEIRVEAESDTGEGRS